MIHGVLIGINIKLITKLRSVARVNKISFYIKGIHSSSDWDYFILLFELDLCA